MKSVVLLVVGVILLLIAGAGGWFVYTKFINPPPEPGKEAEKPKPPPEPPPVYVRIPPIILPVIGSNRVEQQITVVLMLQVADQEAAGKVQGKMPWVSDTFFTTLYGAIDEGHLLNGSLIDIPALKQRLISTSNKLVGKGVVKEVLIQTILQRRL